MIELQSVTKKYGAVCALHNVTFSVEKGAFFALLGPNGAGKTTIIRILLGFSQPTSGLARIDSIPSTNPLARNHVGYLPETVQIPSYLSGTGYIRRQAGLSGMSGREHTAAVERCIDLVGMKEHAHRRCGTYSKGMMQRIGLAAALVGAPRLLILDEPTNGLDPVGIRDFRVILEQVKHDGVTVLLNSHILSEVEKLCSCAAILNKGKVAIKDEIVTLIGSGKTLEDVFVEYVQPITG